MPRQRLDRASELLPARAQALVRARALALGRLGALVARHSPHAELARRRERLDGLAARLKTGRAHALRRAADRAIAARQRLNANRERLARAFAAGLEQRAQALSSVGKLLASYDHRNEQARGFALVRAQADGALVRSAAALAPGDVLTLEFADGRAQAVTRATDAAPQGPAGAAAAKPASKAKPRAHGSGADPGRQGDLF